MESFMQFMMVIIPAGCIGMALAAASVAHLRRDPGIRIERGVPHELPSDINIGW